MTYDDYLDATIDAPEPCEPCEPPAYRRDWPPAPALARCLECGAVDSMITACPDCGSFDLDVPF